MNPASPDPNHTVSREEFEELICVLVHELRNRLNGLSLEAADLAEQTGDQADASRLQQQVQDYSAFLKKIRELLAPETPDAEKIALAEFVKKLRAREIA